MKKEVIQIRKAISKYLLPLKLNATIEDLSNEYHTTILIDFDTRLADKAKRDFDGLQIIYSDGIYEFSEYMAGEKQTELHIFGNYKTINAAFRRVLKGKLTPIHIYN